MAIVISAQLGPNEAIAAPIIDSPIIDFNPQGTQLDDDEILDIGLTNPDKISFKNLILLTEDDGRIDGLRYSTFYDSKELTISSIRLGVDANLFSNNDDYREELGIGLDRFTHLLKPGFIADPFLFLSATFYDFIVNDTDKLVNDGDPDYRVFDFQYKKDGNWIPVAGSQGVEVQPVEVQPVPAPLAILGPVIMGANVIKMKKLAKRLESLKLNKIK